MNVEERKRRDGAILTEHLGGAGTNEIAHRYELTTVSINGILRSQGINRSKMRDRRDQEIFISAINGVSAKALSGQHGVSRARIGQILNSQGINKTKEIAERDAKILDLFSKTERPSGIAEILDLSVDIVNNVLSGSGCRWLPRERDCPICDQSFMRRERNQKFCSDECSSISRERRQNMHFIKTCDYCTKPYRAHRKYRNKQRFCSRACGAKHRWKNKELRNKEVFFLREQQGLTFRRIGEIFTMSIDNARRVYMAQKKANTLERAGL